MARFEVVAQRSDVEEREYPVGYRFPATKDGVVWVVVDVQHEGDTIRHLCRVEAAGAESHDRN
jgi:predicted type IV restriction endonuclease